MGGTTNPQYLDLNAKIATGSQISSFPETALNYLGRVEARGIRAVGFWDSQAQERQTYRFHVTLLPSEQPVESRPSDFWFEYFALREPLFSTQRTPLGLEMIASRRPYMELGLDVLKNFTVILRGRSNALKAAGRGCKMVIFTLAPFEISGFQC
jgi:hypothetical protein